MAELNTLVVRAQDGDLDAYGALVRQFQDMAVGYAYTVLGDFHIDETFPAQGLKLIAEGANHNRIRRLLSPLRRVLCHQQAIRYEMVIDACPAIQCGHKPEEIAARLRRFYMT